jgi:SAM-dependent methyltransferase
VIDWGVGEYESTAAELEPAARHLVSLAQLGPGEDVLDLATGTGNAALLAAAAGAAVTGIDLAPRLIEVARRRAEAQGASASFVVGDLRTLPFEDSTFDVVLSVFGIIFAEDAELAFSEMMRVLRPSGRGLLAVWVPAGPIDAMMGVIGRAMAAATGSTPKRFPWHDTDAIGDVAARHGASVRSHDGELDFEAASPEAYMTEGEQKHPMSLAGRPVLEAAGTYPEVREQALAALREGNQDPDGFRVSSPYRVIDVRRLSTSL